MVQWLNCDNNKDEDNDKDDNDDLGFWHNNQPCGQMHSCQIGEGGVFNDDKYKDGEDKDDNKLQWRQWKNDNKQWQQTTMTNDNQQQQWPTKTMTNNNNKTYNATINFTLMNNKGDTS